MNQSLPMTPPMTPPVIKVTTKNPGRVAAGKRLAEYNRQKKLNKLSKEKLINQEETPATPLVMPAEQKESQSNTLSQKLDFKTLGVIVLIAVGGYLAYKYTRASPPKPTKQSGEPNTKTEETKSRPQRSVKCPSDPFLMQ